MYDIDEVVSRQVSPMKNKLMIGLWRYMINIPPVLWKKQIAKTKTKFKKENGSISAEYRSLHHFVVKELQNVGKPLTAEHISKALHVPFDRVNDTLADLEKRLTFLHGNSKGDVTWAYPLTVDKTPHHVTFNSGEQLYAA